MKYFCACLWLSVLPACIAQTSGTGKNSLRKRDSNEQNNLERILRSDASFQLVGESASALDYDSDRNPRNLLEKMKLEKKGSPRGTKKGLLSTHERPLMNHTSLQNIHKLNVANETLDDSSLRRELEFEKISKPCEGIKKIVQCKHGVEEEICKKDLIDEGVEVLNDMPNTDFFSICVDSEEDAAHVAKLTDVEGIEDDPPRTLSVVPESEREIRNLQRNQQLTPYGIDLLKASQFWRSYGNKGSGVKVCIIDTGLRSEHEDLQDRNVFGSNSRSLVTPWSDDGNGHGTHVAGTVAAADNDIGIVGVAPEASLHIVRVFNNFGTFTASNLVVAMNACASEGANIINMSLGGPVSTFAERTAVRALKNRGILLVAASGNNANGVNLVEYPAGYEEVFSVGAVDADGQIATFSSHNNEVDVAAPGVDIISLGSNTDRSYSSKSGTSMAAPHVAGVAALLWSQFPRKSVDEITEALRVTAADKGICGKDSLFGHGIVDTMAAATFLDSNRPSAAVEQGGCVAVDISLRTDDYGSEQRWIVTPVNDRDNIVARAGPFPDNRRSTYTNSISLPQDCYRLIWLDSFGDGSNNAQYGIGEISAIYGGTQQIRENDFDGSRAEFFFGSCAADSPANGPAPVATQRPIPSPTRAPIPSPTQAPQQAPQPAPQPAPVDPGSGCGNDELLIEMSLETDNWSRSENSLYLFDTASPDDEWIWQVERFELRGRSDYIGNACVRAQSCSRFFFFDDFGDGLSSGGLTLKENGRTVLQILPGDDGDPFQSGSTATFWSYDFGRC